MRLVGLLALAWMMAVVPASASDDGPSAAVTERAFSIGTTPTIPEFPEQRFGTDDKIAEPRQIADRSSRRIKESAAGMPTTIISVSSRILNKLRLAICKIPLLRRLCHDDDQNEGNNEESSPPEKETLHDEGK